MPRNYRKEYDEYQGTPEQKKRRAERNKLRRAAEKAGVVKKGDGKEMDHGRVPHGKSLPNQGTVTSKKFNRSHQPKRSK